MFLISGRRTRSKVWRKGPVDRKFGGGVVERREQVGDHVFQVGDLVTTPRMRDWAGKDKLLVCRIGLSGDEHLLFPLEVQADLPRPFRSADLTLIEAWTGSRLVRCNADASEIIEAGPDE